MYLCQQEETNFPSFICSNFTGFNQYSNRRYQSSRQFYRFICWCCCAICYTSIISLQCSTTSTIKTSSTIEIFNSISLSKSILGVCCTSLGMDSNYCYYSISYTSKKYIRLENFLSQIIFFLLLLYLLKLKEINHLCINERITVIRCCSKQTNHRTSTYISPLFLASLGQRGIRLKFIRKKI